MRPHRCAAAQHLCSIAFGHAHADLIFTVRRLGDDRLHLFARKGWIALVRGQAPGLEPGPPPQALAQWSELAEVGGSLDRATLEPELLRGRIIVNRCVLIIYLSRKHLHWYAPGSDDRLARLGGRRVEQKTIHCVLFLRQHLSLSFKPHMPGLAASMFTPRPSRAAGCESARGAPPRGPLRPFGCALSHGRSHGSAPAHSPAPAPPYDYRGSIVR